MTYQVPQRPIHQKPPRQAKDRNRLALVAAMPCVICYEFGLVQTSPTQVHHCIHGRFGTSRAPDSMTVPLCIDHHVGGRDTTKIALHREPAAWREAYGDDVNWISWVEERL